LFTLAGAVNQSFTPQIILETPKTSAGEITTVTPENKTYTEPMSGFYPATFGFENDANGNIPWNWDDHSDSGCSANIYSEKNGHKKVIRVEDTSAGISEAVIRNYFNSNKTSGTFELWMYKESGTSAIEFEVCNYNSIRAFSVDCDYSNNGAWYYWGTPPTEFASGEYADNTWFHVKVDFECGAGNYKNLSPDTFDLYLNGIKKISGGAFYTSVDSIEFLELDTGGTDKIGVGYFDAIGYSWDPNYLIGDNLNEGLLLSYDNTTSLDWQGYSLDGQANKTVLGNNTFPMPADGHHKIQVFGNNSMGTMYESDLRYFSVFTGPPGITINSPADSELFGTSAPSYDISIAGPYDSIWYALEGGVTNYTASGISGMIDQTAWSALSDGIITIEFFTNNSAGMEGTAQVMVIKDSSEEPPPVPPGIPGYDLFLLIGALSVISALLIRKRVKS
jgi:hypothetical protein